jgi:hypothetical protein
VNAPQSYVTRILPALLLHRSEILDEEFDSHSVFRKKSVVYMTFSHYGKVGTVYVGNQIKCEDANSPH